MYEPAPSDATVAAAVSAATDFAALVRELATARRAHPAEDLITDLVATELSEVPNILISLVTVGGMLGRVTKVADAYVTIEIANGTEVVVQKAAVATLLPKGTIKAL